MNDRNKQLWQAYVSGVGDWIYEHAAETLAGAIALVAGGVFGIWIYLGSVSDRLDAVTSEQFPERLCQRIATCEVWREVAAATDQCEKDQLLCQDRIENMMDRVREIERRLNRTGP